ncbi:Tobamovirus multiplication protein 3 [Hondaea fermentalgiana]|uniref:Tobamovirus multiplication protein 3 n=1 Tax=Hondaea fermentalgiana TaxID=2315210 RepID=A0A2R5G202_9STRA|nr:Tobamovirus multiplication protein 3 [Hondaea fermentalgiana]|eukprot:GBG25022.1 Tobamovirus multiplication protein 3 [Hondaea fermentalgiana]
MDQAMMVSLAPPEGKGWLAGVLACFVCASVVSVVEIVRNRRQLAREPDLPSSSPGWKMRDWFHILLSAALVARSVSIAVELGLGLTRLDTCEHLACWTLSMIHGVPDMLFMTMYSLLTMFWAQLYYATWGISYASLRPGFVAANALLYTIFVVIAFVSLVLKNYRLLRWYMYYLLGGAYIISSMVMMYYGYCVFAQLRSQALATAHLFPTRKKIIARVTIVCLVCSSTLFLHAAYCVAALTVFSSDLGYPRSMGTHAFDALLYTIFELIPSVVVLYVTIKRRRRTAPVRDGASLDRRGFLAEDSNHDSFAPALATPRLQVGQGESLTARLLRTDHELEHQEDHLSN